METAAIVHWAYIGGGKAGGLKRKAGKGRMQENYPKL